MKLTDELIAYAKSQGVNGNIESVFSHFKDHHKAKGTLCLDWEAAWRTWVRREIKYARDRAPHNLEDERKRARELALKGDDQ